MVQTHDSRSRLMEPHGIEVGDRVRIMAGVHVGANATVFSVTGSTLVLTMPDGVRLGYAVSEVTRWTEGELRDGWGK